MDPARADAGVKVTRLAAESYVVDPATVDPPGPVKVIEMVGC